MRPKARNLPGRLRNAWNFATQRQTAEAQATYSELAEKCARAAADLAAVVFARRKFRLACVLYSLCCRSHEFLFSKNLKLTSQARNGMPKCFKSARA